MKQVWPAPERNKEPILDVLRECFAEVGSRADPRASTVRSVLEIASGSGQHAVFFAAQMPHLTWQPSDLDPENLASIRAHRDDAALENLLAPLLLDVLAEDWGLAAVDAVFNANMIHIAPWECCLGLLSGAARLLPAQGWLILYGPFRIDHAHTSESNREFDESLKRRDPRWGVRDLEAVISEAGARGLAFERRVAMPANNQTLIFRRL
jgi:hypothetical protein